MTPTDEAAKHQLDQIELRRQLAEHQSNPDTYDRHNLPATWESTHKYREEVFNITEADRCARTKSICKQKGATYASYAEVSCLLRAAT